MTKTMDTATVKLQRQQLLHQQLLQFPPHGTFVSLQHAKTLLLCHVDMQRSANNVSRHLWQLMAPVLSAEVLQTQLCSSTIIRHVEISLLFNIGKCKYGKLKYKVAKCRLLKFHRFKENGDSCLPLLNIISDLFCLTLHALFVLAFSTPAQSYFIFPYLHFPSLHSGT